MEITGMTMSTGKHWLWLTVALIIFLRVNAEKQKRQIFREQVLPARGGKIPEEAFRTDRLALNRLNKEGISVPDGVVFDARPISKHHHSSHTMADVLKVYLTPDGRYVPPEGRYHDDHPNAVDTTYRIQRPFSPDRKHELNNFRAISKTREFVKPYERHQHFATTASTPRNSFYKPIIAPLVIPTRPEFLLQPYYSAWNPDYAWDILYEPYDDYFIDNSALFNSHQIITDYAGFLNSFHDRIPRHVPSNSGRTIFPKSSEESKLSVTTSPTPLKASISEKSFVKKAISTGSRAYPTITSIPETGFSCEGKNGIYADIKTNCQVFHQCNSGKKISSLCSPGTAFSKMSGRCEWWNTVSCN